MSQFYRTSSSIGLHEALQSVYDKMIEHEQKGEYQNA